MISSPTSDNASKGNWWPCDLPGPAATVGHIRRDRGHPITSHPRRPERRPGLDAVRIRLLEIGEAVKALTTELLDTEPDIPWREIARMRDHLAHRYFDTTHAILQATVDRDLPDLERAVARLTHHTTSSDDDQPPPSAAEGAQE